MELEKLRHSLLGVPPACRPPELGEWPNDLDILPSRPPPHPQRGIPPRADATPFTCGAPGMSNALDLLLEDTILSTWQNVTREWALLTQDGRVSWGCTQVLQDQGTHAPCRWGGQQWTARR